MQIVKAKQIQVEMAATQQAVTAAKELYKYAKLEAGFTENGLGWAQLLAREELKKFPKLQDDGHSLTPWSPRSLSLRVVLARDPHGLLTAFVLCVCMQSSAGCACAEPRWGQGLSSTAKYRGRGGRPMLVPSPTRHSTRRSGALGGIGIPRRAGRAS